MGESLSRGQVVRESRLPKLKIFMSRSTERRFSRASLVSLVIYKDKYFYLICGKLIVKIWKESTLYFRKFKVLLDL